MGAVEKFPSISPAEFEAGCKDIERASINALNGTGLLSIRWTEEELVIKQQRTVTPQHKDEDQHTEDLDVPVLPPGVDQNEIQDSDDEQMVYLSRNSDSDDNLIVDFSITLSPTYCVPVLWFSCRWKSTHKMLSLDQVHEWLVPPQSQAPLKNVGVMGGISMTHHPISELPAFFIHPCQTPEALSSLGANNTFQPVEYLILWLGLIGSSVGLFMPSKLVNQE